eukprot:11226662-Ditylum_brightwellii.AAC.1
MWQVILSHISEYTGGGKYIWCICKTVKLNQGHVLVHPSELYHTGVELTSGVPLFIVCVTDNFDLQIFDKPQSYDNDADWE